MEISFVLQEFDHKPKCWTNKNFDLESIYMESLGSTEVEVAEINIFYINTASNDSV